MEFSRISKLIVKKLLGYHTQEDHNELDAWSRDNKQREIMLSDLSDENKVHDDIRFMQQFRSEKVWRQVRKEIGYSESRIRLLKPMLYAASVLLVIGISLFAYYIISNNNLHVSEVITPGEYKALLTIEEENYILTDTDVSASASQIKPLVNVKEGQLSFKADDTQKVQQITLTVPTRSEYNFVLSDGTKIWMNAGSKVRLKQPFVGNSRDVSVEGEVFLEVKKDENRPFIVHLANDNSIKVLGTRFNIQAYEGESCQKAVLVEGSILWQGHDGIERIMEPGQLLSADLKSNQIEVEEVDVVPYVAWRMGRFVFEGERLEDIMLSLSRWYGIKVIYENEVIKDLHFSIDVRRYENLNDILSMLELTEKICFKINGSEILINKQE